MSKSRRLWRRVVAGAATALLAVPLSPAPAGAAFLTDIDTELYNLEGPLTIHHGDWISFGFVVSAPGTHPEATIFFNDVYLVMPVQCSPDGPDIGNFYVDSGATEVTIPEDDNGVFPGYANTAESGTYQGIDEAHDWCDGGPLYSTRGARLSGWYSSEVRVDLQVAFHYRVPAAKGYPNTSCPSKTGNPYPPDAGPCGAPFSPFEATDPPFQVPVGQLGGLGLAAALGVALVAVSRRRGSVTRPAGARR
jgi:hypothetical protein